MQDLKYSEWRDNFALTPPQLVTAGGLVYDVNDYDVPVDPQLALDCDSCQ